MRHTSRTRRTRRSGNAAGTSLFPFLAVLICTVGTLILVLVVLGRYARVQAAQMAEAKKAESQKNLKEQAEDVRWRSEQLQQSLEAARWQLVDSRLQLGHLEDHSRELRGQLEALERAWNQLNETQQDPRQQAAAETQLRDLSARIVEMRSHLDAARREAMTKRPSYAVVPYEGPHGTRRQPIYLECRADAVVLQPEGIVFKAADFDGPMGPSNPLAAALRAAREHMLRSGQFDPGKAGEPYPLLLVRPLGIHAYYAAREAMSSWESDFGYEMVDADWTLDFGAPDPELAEVVRQAIEAARARQLRLVEAAPRHYRHLAESSGGDRPQYTVSQGTGVVVPYGATDEEDSWPRGRRHQNPEGHTQRSAFSGGGDSPTGTDERSGPPSMADDAPGGTGGGTAWEGGSGEVTSGPGSGGPGGDSLVSEGAGAAGNSMGPSLGGMSGDPLGGSLNGSPGGSRGGTSGGAVGDSSGSGSAGALGGSSVGVAGAATSGGAAGSLGSSACPTPGGSAGGSLGSSRSAAVETAVSTGSNGDSGQSPFSAGREENAQAGNSQTTGAPRRLGEWYPSDGTAGDGSSGQPSMHKPPKHKEKSLADKRGRDWAVPDASPAATPLVHPIRIECHADRLVLVAQRGLAGGRSVALGPQTRDTVDELVSAIWSYTEGWGMAGNGMYWRPVLHVYVYPGAKHRYDDLENLLRDSGLLIERKQ